MATSATDREPGIESPCIRKCTLDDDDVCVGCYRNIEEICSWSSAGYQQRREILASAAARQRRKPGRA